MTKRIGIIGSPGSGKSTCAAGVYSKLKLNGFSIELVQEAARHQINMGWEYKLPSDQFRILMHQRRYEDSIPESTDIIISDSPVLLTLFYALWNTNDPENYTFTLSDLYFEFLKELKRYDLLVFLNRTKEYINDGTRIQSEVESNEISRLIKALLDLHHVKYLEMPGNENTTDYIVNWIRDENI